MMMPLNQEFPRILQRIAFVADGNYGNTRRFAQGVSEDAVPKNGMICREFFYPEGASYSPASSHPLPKELVSWDPAAILYSGTAAFIDDFQPFLQKGIPLFVLNHLPRTDIPLVISDKQETFGLVHEHLGNRVASIALFLPGNPLTYALILEQYRLFCERRGVVCSYYEHDGTGPLENIRRTTQIDSNFADWLKAQPKPLGLFTVTTHIGLFLSRCCQLAGLRVPEDVMLIGIDDFDVAQESDPSVTSIRLALEAMGTRAVQLASEQLAGRTPPMLVNVSGASIVVRRSTLVEKSKEWNLDAALAFIEKHACEGINVEDVRTHTQSMSREGFQRKFVASAGITPRRALEARRMGEARRMLLETEMSPSWIAGMCGYPDYTHFFKLFRKLNGVSPTEFRNSAG